MSTVNNNVKAKPNPSNLNQKTGKPKVSSRGGARPNSGPKSQLPITVGKILEEIDNALGEEYSVVLARHFAEVVAAGDRNYIYKYHNLILNKVAPTLLDVTGTVEHVDNTIEGRQVAFLKALESIGQTMSTVSNVDLVIPAPVVKAGEE